MSDFSRLPSREWRYTAHVNIGCVPYLNACPLVEGLERNPPPGITLTYAPPALLIRSLQAGTLDLIMASTVAVLEHPEWHLLPGIGVTAAGPTLSVPLVSAVPVPEIRTLALDTQSRSTVTLAQIILADRYGVRPACLPHPPDLSAMLRNADAAVLIGDVGLATTGEGYCMLDLGEEWWALTGLPFYFAGWMARDAAVLAQAASFLLASMEEGIAEREAIARREAIRRHLPVERCRRYLIEVMRYRAGEAATVGLAEFHRRAVRLGVLS